ncbi:MAG TPA: choice-of-anchor tandem repeat GloVer-containing protein [Rhizomicrobium sp.]|nr:choice-of-anchor tandem repeat GloVer-containing protein [Rhizomicrobium sp.]
MPDCPDGMGPTGGLAADQSGNLVGVLGQGGKYGHGGVFRWDGSQANLIYSFCKKEGCPDEYDAFNEVVFDSAGDIYGVTAHNGVNSEGSVFELTP